MTLNPSIGLQKAIYSKLDRTGYKVFEIVPSNEKFPYIQIGEEILTDYNTKTDNLTVHNLTVHTWSKGNSSTESKQMNQLVKDTLLGELTVSGFGIVMSTLEMMTTLKEETNDDSIIFHGVLQVRYLIVHD